MTLVAVAGQASKTQRRKRCPPLSKLFFAWRAVLRKKTFDVPTNPKFMDADWQIFREITQDMTRGQQCAAKRSGHIGACAIIKRNADELKRLAVILYETEIIDK